MTDKAHQFTRELKSLILKYNPEIVVQRGYCGDIYGVDFIIDGAVCVTKDYDQGHVWDFGDGLVNLKEEIKRK